jgi:hypothetical protein
MYIFSGHILPAQHSTFHKSEKYTSDSGKPVFLRFWRTGLRDFDGDKRISQLSVRGAYGKNEPEGRADCGGSNQYRYFMRI